jgi:hypothetical protein
MVASKVRCLDILKQCHPSVDTTKVLAGLFTIFAGINICCAIVLVCNTDEDGLSAIGHEWSAGDFHESTVDCLYLAILQALLLAVVCMLAVLRGRWIKKLESVRSCSCCQVCYPSALLGSVCLGMRAGSRPRKYSMLSTAENSLNGSDDDGDDDDAMSMRRLDKPLMVEDPFLEFPSGPTILEGFESEKPGHKCISDKEGARVHMQKSLDFERNVWLGTLFAISTASQVYLGLKCVSFAFDNEGRDGVLMGLGVLWINILIWILREIVIDCLSLDGELFSDLHPHKLHLQGEAEGIVCDGCHQPTKAGDWMYRCKLCDFDICSRCFARRDKLTFECQIRGDKGVRPEASLSIGEYFMRAVGLAKSEWKALTVAVLSLCAFTGFSLWTPTLQGSILNAVVDLDKSNFYASMKLYLMAAVFAGLLGGLQEFCFKYVGSSIGWSLRKRLFNSIIMQDMAFFDGGSTGKLYMSVHKLA